MNPTAGAQTVRVSLLGTPITRALTLPPRSRQAVELGSWGASGDFGVEVSCGAVCAASLVMWDAAMRESNVSVPLTGCVER